MNDFFPFTGSEEDYKYSPRKDLPLFKELAYDFKKNDFIIDKRTNDIKVLEGKEALEVWVYKAILTNRYEHEIYSWSYGTELINLIGQKFSRGLTESEAFRYIKEALMINPYITDVINKDISFINDVVNIKILVDSIYGEVLVSVRRQEL